MSEAIEKIKQAKLEYKSDVKPTWCPGCGDYGVLASFIKALGELKIPTHKLSIVSGIGCSSRFPHFVKGYNLHTVHGRALPVALGVKIANPELEVFVIGGDGDGFAIGGGHIPHVARRNPDMVYIILDNAIYGLTKGQVSPTSTLTMTTTTTPYGALEPPLNPIMLLLAYGASFVARGFSSNTKQLTQLIVEATRHKGFAVIQVISPCPTFNMEITFDFVRERVVEIPPKHDPTNKLKAFELAMVQDKIYTGIFYREERPTFEGNLDKIVSKFDGNIDELSKKERLEKLFEQFA